MDNDVSVKTKAVLVLKKIIDTASYKQLEILKPEFFKRVVGVLRNGIFHEGINAALHIMFAVCRWGKAQLMMVKAGAVFELVELELWSPEKRTTELILGVLSNLCSRADGRAQLLSHVGGIAVVSKRILKVSLAADNRAILILSLICEYSRNIMVPQEMLMFRAVSKICKVLKVDCAPYLKDIAKEIPTSHFDVWKNSPCIDGSLLKRRAGSLSTPGWNNRSQS
ncbi:hypothetical protein L1049_007641 [Liquidambar formosana]|uniref:U-box domain-containing protein n=1 Tax=Liquidambar formosana TaxID=63359 RepID=A0AAP0S8L8_LIQFO